MTDFPVNTFTAGSQSAAAVAMDDSGNYVVFWASAHQDGSGEGIYGQRYNAAGVAQGAEFRANTTVANVQKAPAVAMDADGDFVVTWQSFGQDGAGEGIYAQRYNAAGLALGGEFRVNTTIANNQLLAAVAMDADGDFVIAWHSSQQDGSQNGVYAQRYNAAGVALGAEFLVNTHTNGNQDIATVAMDADGDFVVAWDSVNQDPSDNGRGIYAQRFNAAGVAQGVEFRVNTYRHGDQRNATVAMDADGDFVVAWESSGGQDGSGYGIYAQRYNAAGVAQGGEFRVNTVTAGSQTNAAVAMDADGDFIVSWQSEAQDGSGYGIYAQRYNAAGVAQGGEFLVNTGTADNQRSPAVAMDADGDLVIAWHSTGQDGSGDGVFLARFAAAGDAVEPALVLDLDAAAPGFSAALRTFVGGQAGTLVFGDVSCAGSGSTTASGAQFRFTARPGGVSDVLSIAPGLLPAGVTAAWDAAQGILTLSGVASLAAYESLIEAVTYTSATPPAPGDRLIAVQISDGAQRSNLAQAGFAVTGGDSPVNTTSANSQYAPSVAMDVDGDFVVVWSSYLQDGSFDGIYAQRYDAVGAAQGREFRVNTVTAEGQSNAAMAMDADGDFVLAWQSMGQDGSSYGIYAQRYDAAGVAQGTEFRVNTVTADSQRDAAVAMDADGDFVVAWASTDQDGSSAGVYAQRFNAAGVAQGAEFRVNTFTAEQQGSAAVAMGADGDFVVAWASNGQDGSGFGVYAQRFDAAGVALGGEFRVNTTTAENQLIPSLAMAADGDFVVTWQSNEQDGSVRDVYAQRYNAAGLAQGAEFRVNTFTTGDQSDAAAVMDADGDLVVVWQSAEQDGSSHGVFAARFDAAGKVVTPALVLDLDAATPGFNAISVALTGDPGRYFALGDVSFAGSGSATASGAVLRLTARPDGPSDLLSIAAGLLPAGVTATWNGAQATLTLSGEASLAAYEAMLEAVLYVGGAVPRLGEGAIEVQVSAGAQTSNVATSAFAVAAGDLPVNTFTTDRQGGATVAMEANGDFVVAWHSAAQDGSGYGVYAQRFDAAGVVQGAEFRVNTVTQAAQLSPAVAMDADGHFVVAWQSRDQDGSNDGIYAQRYNAAGVAQGEEFRVNVTTADRQRAPAVAMDADGDFVVAWHSNGQDGGNDGVYARRYNAAGVAQGSEFLVNTTTANAQNTAAVAIDADGDFVVAWQSRDQDGNSDGIYAQRYNAAGVAQGGEFRVNTTTAGGQRDAAVAMDADGDFVVAWQSYGQDGSGDGVYAQRYNAAGLAQGPEFRVNTTTANNQSLASVAMDADGDFLVSWQSSGQDGSFEGVYAQRYNAAGVAQGQEYRVNAFNTNAQNNPAVAMDADGDATVVWRSRGQDGDRDGVFMARLTATDGARANLDLDLSAAGSGFSTVFRAGDGQVAISDSDVGLAGAARTGAGTITAVLGGVADGGAESLTLAGSPAGVTAQAWNAATKTLSLTIAPGTAPSDIQAAIAAIRYANSATAPTAGERSVGVSFASGGSSTNLALSTITVEATNRAPTAIDLSAATVAENAAGASIGTLSVTDPDAGDTHSFTLSDSRFEVVAGVLKLRAGQSLNHEAAASVSVQVTATDAGGLALQQGFTITVSNVNEAPVGAVSLARLVSQEGLIATPSLSDPDGIGTISFRWQTSLDGLGGWTTVGSQTAASYLPGSFAQAQFVRSLALYTDGGGFSESVTAAPMALVGTALGDTLVASDAAPIVLGRAGNDLILAHAGAARLDGGSGVDTVSYAGSTAVNVNLATGAASGGHAAGDVLSGIEGLIGGTGADVFTGNDLANQLSGQDGDDRLIGDLGNDVLNGGLGADTLVGGAGRDVLSGGAGADRFVWTAATESQATSTGRDLITDWEIGDRIDLSGFDADAVQAGLQGFTYMGTTTNSGVAAVGELWSYVFGGSTFVIGGIDGDTVRDFQIEIAGSHVLNFNSFIGSSGSSATNDRLQGSNAADTLAGLAGNDTLIGGAGNDSLLGGEGADSLIGGTGNDTLMGGVGKDVMAGGSGADRFVWTDTGESPPTAAGRDVIADWGLGDRIDLTGFDANTLLAGLQGFTFRGTTADPLTAAAGDLWTYVFGGNTYVILGVDGDTARDFQIELTGVQTLTLGSFIGVGGRIEGTGANDTLTGFEGADTLLGGAGADTLLGGAGTDALIGGAGKDLLSGGAGADRFVWTNASETPATAAGRDVITDWGAGDRLDLAGFDANTVLAGIQGFTFRGTTANTATAAAGDLWTYVFGGKTYVIGGVDGDTTRDFQIEINGATILTGADFIL